VEIAAVNFNLKSLEMEMSKALILISHLPPVIASVMSAYKNFPMKSRSVGRTSDQNKNKTHQISKLIFRIN